MDTNIELVLNSHFEFDEAYAFDQISKFSLGGGSCARIGGIRFRLDDSGGNILAWQCNLADVQNMDVKLPTIISIHLNTEKVIESISLNRKFKGSQGITCSYAFLERRMQDMLTGETFIVGNRRIKDPNVLYCRHVYELIYGACTFAEWCVENDNYDAYQSETTIAYTKHDCIISYDKVEVNHHQVLTKIDISNFLSNLKYDRDGAIKECSDIKIVGYRMNGSEYEMVGEKKRLTAGGGKEFKMRLMKIISKYWIDSGKRLGIRKNFHFSQIWAPTFFGIISQAFALALFNKNYSYFQHCVAGIQRVNDIPYCIGVIKDVSEGKKYFEDFQIEDLY